jgi:hypothetical protein
MGLAAISYDTPETLKAFAEARGITFPLLSDRNSETIRRYNILNQGATGRSRGIPHPGTFLVDARGIVTARSFEERYQERASAASLLSRLPEGAAAGSDSSRTETHHLILTTSISDRRAPPGTRVSLLLDVVPKPKMHVYAPGQQDMIPITLTLTADAAFAAHEPRLPKPEKYFFAPLQETYLVYSSPFRIAQDITIAVTSEMRKRPAAPGASLRVSGTLRYQACDDKLCYMPQELPVAWTIELQPMER